MGVLRRFREWREDKDGVLTGPDINANSVSTGSITDSQDGQAWETLRGAGFDKGDFIPLLTASFAGDETTTSSNYTRYAGDNIELSFIYNDLFPNNATPQARALMTVGPSSDQVDLRIQNPTDGLTIAEVADITGDVQSIEVGPSEFNPSTKSTRTFNILEYRNGGGATSVKVFDGVLQFGVKI